MDQVDAIADALAQAAGTFDDARSRG